MTRLHRHHASAVVAAAVVAFSFECDAVDYHVALAPEQPALSVRVCGGKAGKTLELVGSSRAATFATALRRSDGGAVERRGNRIVASSLPAGVCIDYRVDIAAAAESADRLELDVPAWLLSPDDWLWRERPAAPATLRLQLPRGWSASLPWPRTSADWTYALDASAGSNPALTAFGRFAAETIDLPGGKVELAVLAEPGSEAQRRWSAWQHDAAALLLQAYGRLPVPQIQALVIPIAGRDGGDPVPWAQTRRGGGLAVHFYVARNASAQVLRDDWTAAHEYAHFLHPYLGASGRWLAEGLASYYQNVLRARAGLLSEHEAWRLLHAGFVRGQRQGGGSTLDEAARRMPQERQFMRVYWSGAAYWLEADLALRTHDRGAQTLDEALSRFAACCLPQSRGWTPERFTAELDRVLDTDVFAPLYARYRHRRDVPDLSDAYERLGLRADGAELRFDGDETPTRLRRSIMAPSAETPSR